MRRVMVLKTKGEETRAHVYDLPLGASLKYSLLQGVEELDAAVTRHWLCGANLPEAFWRIPVGKSRPVEGGERMVENSVGDLLYGAFTRLYSWGTDFEEHEVVELPLSPEEAKALE